MNITSNIGISIGKLELWRDRNREIGVKECARICADSKGYTFSKHGIRNVEYSCMCGNWQTCNPFFPRFDFLIS